jgi:hypothetical protein
MCTGSSAGAGNGGAPPPAAPAPAGGGAPVPPGGGAPAPPQPPVVEPVADGVVWRDEEHSIEERRAMLPKYRSSIPPHMQAALA